MFVELFAPQLGTLLHVVQLNPDIHFAIAVMGWPLDLGPSGFARWKRDLAVLSACPNVSIIISAVECVFGMNWSIPQAKPWIDTIFRTFRSRQDNDRQSSSTLQAFIDLP